MMSTYARIAGGIVAELFTPPAGVAIAACFYQSLTWVECDGTPGVTVGWTAIETEGAWAFTAPAAPPAPTLAQQAATLLTGGIAITSAGTPALNATYPTTGPIWADLKDEALFIASFASFSSGGAGIAFVLPSGPTVTFTATAQLQAAVKAISMYLSALKTIAATNTGTLPSASATIA